jgi:hypothetical protein
MDKLPENFIGLLRHENNESNEETGMFQIAVKICLHFFGRLEYWKDGWKVGPHPSILPSLHHFTSFRTSLPCKSVRRFVKHAKKQTQNESTAFLYF